MANDDVLSIVTGLLEGVASVYVPFQQELQKSRIRQNEGEQTLQRDIRLKQATLPMEEAAKRSEAQFQTGEDVRKETLLSPLKMGQEQAKQDRENYITQSDVPPSVLPKLGYKKGDQFKIRKETLPFEVGSMKAGMESYANVRQKQNILQDLPSRSSVGTVPGAAAQVQFASKQLKQLIAKPITSPQKMSLVSSDLARIIQRSAPHESTLGGSDFSNNLQTKFSKALQKLTSTPQGRDVPALRKEIWGIADDMEKSSRPFLERSLDQIENAYQGSLPENWKDTRTKELWDHLSDVEFQDKETTTRPDGISNQNTGWDQTKESRYQELLKKKQSGTLQK